MALVGKIVVYSVFCFAFRSKRVTLLNLGIKKGLGRSRVRIKKLYGLEVCKATT